VLAAHLQRVADHDAARGLLEVDAAPVRDRIGQRGVAVVPAVVGRCDEPARFDLLGDDLADVLLDDRRLARVDEVDLGLLRVDAAADRPFELRAAFGCRMRRGRRPT